MTDTTREAFEAWHKEQYGQAYNTWVEEKERYAWDLTQELWITWKTAAERATQVERERCAVLAGKLTNQSRVVHGGMNAVQTPECKIAAAIRQGGAG